MKYEKDSHFFRLLVLLIVVLVMCTILQPKLFPRFSTFSSIAKQFPEFGILSIGIGLALLTGGIDLSSVAVANLSAIIAAKIMIKFAPKDTPPVKTGLVILVAILASIAIGVICGIINGSLISRIGIPAILATLGTQQLYSGIAIVITEGKPQSGLPIIFSKVGNKTLFGFLPVTLIVFILCAIGVGIMLSRSVLGHQTYMVGTNPLSARYAGINNPKVVTTMYAVTGGLASLAGLIMTARTNSAKADFGASYTLQCVLISVLGGMDPSGGKGNVGGIVLAVIILQSLSTTLSMFENISNFYRDIIWGLALIGVLVANHYLGIRTQRKQAERANAPKADVA